MPEAFSLLYPLRHPFTSLTLKKIDSKWVDLSVSISGRFAGTLRIARLDAEDTILQCFANHSHPVGELYNGQVDWTVKPTTFGFDQVIDQEGNIHNVTDLGEQQ